MPRRITADDLYRIQQPGECRLSPDASKLAVVVARSEKEKLHRISHIWMVPVSGGKPRQFTQGNHSDSHPRFSPDGRFVAFISNRSEKSEIWVIPTDGGEARQLTKLQGAISDFEYSPDGRRLAAVFTPVDAEAKERETNKKKGLPGQESPKVRAVERIFYKLDGAGFIPKSRSHLWIVDPETGRAKALTSDDRRRVASRILTDGKWIYQQQPFRRPRHRSGARGHLEDPIPGRGHSEDQDLRRPVDRILDQPRRKMDRVPRA
jgi:acylaminoacyl-peptidase